MYAVICSPQYFKDIESVVSELEDQIAYKTLGKDVDIKKELNQAERLPLKYLIVDISAVDKDKAIEEIRGFRIKRTKTTIIIISPGGKPGDMVLSEMVSMGVYDIITPDEDEDFKPELTEIIRNPLSYAKAVRWHGKLNVTDSQVASTGKVEVKEKIVEKVKIEKEYVVESVFKKVFAVYSPTGEGSSCIAAHLAHALADSKKCKVLLMDFNPVTPCQREKLDLFSDYSLKDAIDAVIKRTLSNVVLESYTKESKSNRHVSILPGLYDISDFYGVKGEDVYEEIIEKAKFSYDYVVIDTHSFYDFEPTDVALRLADEVVVPVRARMWSIDTLNRYMSMFEQYDDFDTRKFKVVINKYSGDDLTCIETEPLLKNELLGYISNFKEYESNGFKNKKLMDEYVPILNKLGIRAEKKKTILDKLFRR